MKAGSIAYNNFLKARFKSIIVDDKNKHMIIKKRQCCCVTYLLFSIFMSTYFYSIMIIKDSFDFIETEIGNGI